MGENMGSEEWRHDIGEAKIYNQRIRTNGGQ